jgi:hypothetical protein
MEQTLRPMRCTTLYMNGVSGCWIESSLARLFRSSVFRFPNSYLPFAARTRISPPHEQFIRRSRTRQLTGFSFSAFRFHASALLSPRTLAFLPPRTRLLSDPRTRYCSGHEHVFSLFHDHVLLISAFSFHNSALLFDTITSPIRRTNTAFLPATITNTSFNFFSWNLHPVSIKIPSPLLFAARACPSGSPSANAAVV